MFDSIAYLVMRLREENSEMGNVWDRLFLSMWLFISFSTLLD